MGESRSLPLPRWRNAHELSRSNGLGCSLFARHYWGNRYCLIFLRVLRWFTSPRSPLASYGFRSGYSDMTRSGLPHSEIPGSKPVCGSPRLIAAYHVLHRRPAPRHPPCALSSLTYKCLYSATCKPGRKLSKSGCSAIGAEQTVERAAGGANEIRKASSVRFLASNS